MAPHITAMTHVTKRIDIDIGSPHFDANTGDVFTGTYTVNDPDITPQTNMYQDGTANVSGQRCTP